MAITFNGYAPSYPFILYILVSSVGGLAILQYLYKSDKPIAAMLTLVLLILVFVFFNLRWFSNMQLKGTASYVAQSDANASSCGNTPLNVDGGVNANWPPIINICPDYMVSQNGKCIDPSNLYGNRGGGTGSTGTQITIGNSNCGNYNLDYLRWEGVVESDGRCIQSKIPAKA